MGKYETMMFFLISSGFELRVIPQMPETGFFCFFSHPHRNTEIGPKRCFYSVGSLSGAKYRTWEVHPCEISDKHDKKSRMVNNKLTL